MRSARFCLPIVLLCALAACDSAEPGPDDPSALTVVSTNVEADGVLYGNALRVQLSAPLDTASLAAAHIETISTLSVIDGPDYVPQTIERPLAIWKVRYAEAVTLNGEPATFWYDPASASVLMLDEQTDYGQPPYTPFSSGTNVVEFTTAVRSTEGEALAAPVAVSFELRELTPGGRLAALSPNPVFGVTAYSRTYDERIARFVGLPETATIVIQDPLGETVTLEKDDQNSTLDWATPLDRTGLFSYEVLQEGEAFARGIAVLAAEAYRPDAP